MAMILAYQGEDAAVIATDLGKDGRERLVRSPNGAYYFAFAPRVPPLMERFMGALTLDRLVNLGFPDFKAMPSLKPYAGYNCIVVEPKKPQLYFRKYGQLDAVKADAGTKVCLLDKKEPAVRRNFQGKSLQQIADSFIEWIEESLHGLEAYNGYAAYISRGGKVVKYSWQPIEPNPSKPL